MDVAASLDSWLQDHSRRRRAKQALWLSIGLTVLLYVIPLGGFVAYPLMLFSTLVHELGHGLTALLMGGSFKQMVIFSDGSGVATHGGLGADAAGHLQGRPLWGGSDDNPDAK